MTASRVAPPASAGPPHCPEGSASPREEPIRTAACFLAEAGSPQRKYASVT